MAFTYNLTTDIGKVRRDIRDIDGAQAAFTDEELTSFLAEADSNVKGAAGLALLAWAVQLSQEDELVSTGAWKGDRRNVAAKMQKIAAEYLKMAGIDGPPIAHGFAEMDWTAHAATQREINEVMRG